MPAKRIADEESWDEFQTELGFAVDDEGKVTLTDSVKHDTKRLKTAGKETSDAKMWIYRNKTDLTPSRKREITTQLDDASAAFDVALQEQKTKELDEQTAATLSIKPSITARAGDGNCYVTFVNVGLGDCTLITSPYGRRIMVDCGSSAMTDAVVTPVDGETDKEREARAYGLISDRVNSKSFRGGEDKKTKKAKKDDREKTLLHMLLLTHPDKDHYNKLDTFLDDAKFSEIGIVYYGGMEAWDKFGLKTVDSFAKGNKHWAILRDDEDSGDLVQLIDGKPIVARSGTSKVLGAPYVDPVTDTIVLYCEQEDGSKEPEFKVSLLAANSYGAWFRKAFVTSDMKVKGNNETGDDATEENRRSLVVLVEFAGQGFLICGDASATTETFIRTRFPDCLKKVTHLRIGHHGSPTSSSRDFIKAMPNLKVAVASSSGRWTKVHGLPKEDIIEEYAKVPKGAAGQHPIWCFGSSVDATPLQVDNQRWTTGSNDTRFFPIAPITG